MNKGKLSQRYETLAGDRSPFLSNAELFCRMTLPYLMENGKEGNTHGYQGLGAEVVNHLANKMVTTLFPIGEAFFVLDTDPDVEKAMTDSGIEKTQIAKYLTSISQLAIRYIPKLKMRAKLVNYFKYMVVTGNACLQFTDDGVKVFGLQNYVVKRSPEGELLEGIIKEGITKDALPSDIRVLVDKRQPGAMQRAKNKEKGKEQVHDLYTSYCLQPDGSFLVSQAVDEIPVKDTNTVEADRLPVIFGRWNSKTGEDYGRGLVEDHRGDFNAYEFLCYARARGCAVMMDVKYLVKPGALTDVKALNEAEIGEFVQGQEGDINVLQLEKFADNRLINDVINEYKERLYRAFQKLEGAIRDSERTTKYEVMRVANELEVGLGGIYTSQSEELQPAIARQLLDRIDPDLLNPDIQPTITTGLEALGRARRLEKLLQYSEMMAIPQGWPETVQQRMDWNAYEAYIADTIQLDTVFLIPADKVKREQEGQADMEVNQEMAQSIASGAGQAIGKRIGEGIQ